MRKVYILIIIVATVCISYSCKHTTQVSYGLYNPTAYTLVYPDFVNANIGTPVLSADNPLTVQGVALGRRLFYEKILSGNMTISCGSCHNQRNSFDDSNQFSKGANGALGDRNAMAIVNMAWNDRFFWDGRRNSLEGQAHDPVVNPIEMNNKWAVAVSRLQKDTDYPTLFFQAFGTSAIDSNLVTKAIAQFERTLISYNSLFDQYQYLGTKTLTFEQAQGYMLFKQAHCIDCHAVGLFADNVFRNNGLDLEPADSGLAKFTHNPSDYGKFKVPSLRNVALTAPYMHDGRFETLQQAVGFYNGGIVLSSPNIDSNMLHVAKNQHFTVKQMENIVAFLETLTDSSFIFNPIYSNL